MRKRIKWIIGVGALVAAPLSLLAAPTANAGVGGCATATPGQPLGSAPTYFAFCSSGVVIHCTNHYNPLGTPIDQLASKTVSWAVCSAL